MRPVFALAVFRRIVYAYAIEQLAITIAPVALAVLVYRRTGSALGAAGFFICADVLPALIAPPVVARLDRSSLRLVLPPLYGAQVVLFAVLAWLVHHFSLTPVLVLTVLTGTLSLTARSLLSAGRVSILRPHGLLRDGAAVMSMVFSAIFFAGPLIGGGVVATGGAVAALLAICGLLAAVGLVLALTALPLPDRPDAEGREGAVRRLRHGIGIVRANRFISRMITLQFAGLIFFSLTIPVEVIYAQHTLRAGPGGYGTLLALWGGGALVGSAGYARWRHSETVRLLTASAIALLIGFGVMAAAPTLAIALIGDVIGGIGNGIWGSAARTAVQERTEDRWMAVTMSVSDSATMLAPGIGILIGGAIAAIGDARAAFAAAAAGALVFALAAPLALRGSGEVPAEPGSGIVPEVDAPRDLASQDRARV